MATPLCTPLSLLFSLTLPAVAIGSNGQKPAQRSAMAAIDISKAFDSVDHVLLIEVISSSSLRSNYVRWLAAYLRGRTASCDYNGAWSPTSDHSLQSSARVCPLACALQSYFISDCPNQAEVHSSHADDLSLLESDINLDTLGARLNSSVNAASDWSKKKNPVV